jgi:hypothetical protein
MTTTSLGGTTDTLSRLAQMEPSPGKVGELVTEVNSLGGPPIRYRVVTETLGQMLVPSEIIQESLNGRRVGTIEFRDYEPAGSQNFLFPRSLSLRGFDEAGMATMRAEIIITSLEIDEPLREDQFIIRGDEETAIWDNERARYVEAWPPED